MYSEQPRLNRAKRQRLIAAHRLTASLSERHSERAMPPLDRSIVANVPIFAAFSGDDLDAILREARSIRYPKDSSVFDQGSEAHSFFVLLHGHLRVEKTTPHGQVRVGLFFPVSAMTASQHAFEQYLRL